MKLRPTLFKTAAELSERLRAEIQALQDGARPKLLSLATGSTFADFFSSLEADCPLFDAPLHCTHLDEYLGFEPEQRGGMAWELLEGCAPLARMQREGRFHAFPHRSADLALHAARIAALGGVALQLLGIGRNGHLAFNEPGTSPDSRFHEVELHPWTMADAAPRFGRDDAPGRALSAGLADILGARRIVLVARGKHKAQAVRRMLLEPPNPDCPASLLQGHADVHVLLDPEAAAQL